MIRLMAQTLLERFELTLVGVKTSDPKALTTDSSKSKEKSRKEYVPKDPESYPSSSDSSSRESDSSDDSKYINKRRNKNKKHWKHKKQYL